MAEKRVPTRQNQPVEILMFPADAFGAALIIFIIAAVLGYTNLGFALALAWLHQSKQLKEKGKGYLKHKLWSKGHLPRIASRGIPNPNVRQYLR